nr:MAG TPA: restriction alleviation protein [Caudoviricetes sp.]
MELKPCPFCGGKANIEAFSPRVYQDVYSRQYVIKCSRCGIKTSAATKTIGMDGKGRYYYERMECESR